MNSKTLRYFIFLTKGSASIGKLDTFILSSHDEWGKKKKLSPLPTHTQTHSHVEKGPPPPETAQVGQKN